MGQPLLHKFQVYSASGGNLFQQPQSRPFRLLGKYFR